MTVKGLMNLYKDPHIKKVMRSILIGILYLLGIMIFVLMIENIGWSNFISSIKIAKINFVACAVFFYILSNFLRGTKWYVYYKDTYKNARFINLISIYLSSNLFNNMLPTRLGDLFSLTALKTSNKYSLSKISSVFVLDKAIEAVFMVLFFLASILFLALNGNYVKIEMLVIVFSFLMLVGVLLFIIFSKRSLRNILKIGLHKMIPEKFFNKIEVFFDNFIFYFKNIIKSSKLMLIVLITLTCWLMDFTAMYFAVNSIYKISFLHSVTAQCISIPISLISFIPNGMGISSLSYVKVTDFFGYETIKVVSASIFSKVTFLIVLNLLGLLAYFVYVKQLKCSNKNL